MRRKDFVKYLTLFPLGLKAMQIKELKSLVHAFDPSDQMPILFFGHGSPMNAIEENEFVEGFRNSVKDIPSPKAILCISAHWETRGTFVTAMETPKTIHDFGGFPPELYQVQYPAPGSPEWAMETKQIITQTSVGLNYDWGLDHGTWSVVKHLYPQADVPIFQLSLDYTQSPIYHFELARQMAELRQKGVLIIGSGNMVHNLRLLDWNNMQTDDFAFDWAREANEKMKTLILQNDFKSLTQYQSLGKAFQMSIPTPEHFLPLLYILALKKEQDSISFFNDKAVAGSLTMTSVKIG
ncbi:MAG: 4,5-DOPA dioxygenase extradiol [Flavobacteriaceae bacterium]|nr:4,5-DOPA dioxygenase extradiol [Flavobacteriaceae bacterium]